MTSPDETPLSRPQVDAGLNVVGIGASAGGIAALQAFFSNADPGAGIAWVVILHLSPEHESRLAEVLQSTTSMAVAQVTAPVTMAGNHVYVIPPNAELDIQNGQLIVNEFRRAHVRSRRRLPRQTFVPRC